MSAASLIAGQWRAGEPSATQMNAVVDAASAAAPALAALGHLQTANLLEAVADEILAADGEVVSVADRETALGEGRLRGELGRTAVQFRLAAAYLRSGEHFEAVIDPADPSYSPAPRPDLRRSMIPLGSVAVFAASNFPFAFGVAGTDTAAALAAGCPVVVKAHPGHPATSQLLGECIHRTCNEFGLPPGAFSLVQGSGTEVGSALVTHPALEAVAFTGSTRGGRALHDLASRRPRPIPVFAEMGSVNPVFIFPGALQARSPQSLAGAYVASLLLGAGQFCTCPGLVAVPDSEEGAAFIEAAAQAVAEYPGATLLTEQIAEAYRRGAARLLEHARGVTANPGVSGLHAQAHLVELPLDDVLAEPTLREEVFGPAGVVIRCAPDRFPELLQAVGGSLTVTIHATTSDRAAAAGLNEQAARFAGRVLWDSWPTGVAVTRAMHHGGPWPATSAPAYTSVGVLGIRRFQRPVVFQGTPDYALPAALQDANPLGIPRCVDGTWTTSALTRGED